jgi:hypothetical protein
VSKPLAHDMDRLSGLQKQCRACVAQPVERDRSGGRNLGPRSTRRRPSRCALWGSSCWRRLPRNWVFRGMLYHVIARTSIGHVGAIVVPAQLFAAFHVEQGLRGLPFILVDGLILGVTRYATDSTSASSLRCGERPLGQPACRSQEGVQRSPWRKRNTALKGRRQVLGQL